MLPQEILCGSPNDFRFISSIISNFRPLKGNLSLRINKSLFATASRHKFCLLGTLQDITMIACQVTLPVPEHFDDSSYMARVLETFKLSGDDTDFTNAFNQSPILRLFLFEL